MHVMLSRNILIKAFSSLKTLKYSSNFNIFYVPEQKHVSSQPRSSHISTGKNPQLAMNYYCHSPFNVF